MIRDTSLYAAHAPSIPRESGDDPTDEAEESTPGQYSPRERG